jgi:exosome complex RNA-binding protein Rrp42 (RNase PH superfamily)
MLSGGFGRQCYLAGFVGMHAIMAPAADTQCSVGYVVVNLAWTITNCTLLVARCCVVVQSGAILVSDATLSEEAASSGRATLFINPHGEICGWQMAEGVGLDQAQMMR